MFGRVLEIRVDPGGSGRVTGGSQRVLGIWVDTGVSVCWTYEQEDLGGSERINRILENLNG